MIVNFNFHFQISYFCNNFKSDHNKLHSQASVSYVLKVEKIHWMIELCGEDKSK